MLRGSMPARRRCVTAGNFFGFLFFLNHCMFMRQKLFVSAMYSSCGAEGVPVGKLCCVMPLSRPPLFSFYWRTLVAACQTGSRCGIYALTRPTAALPSLSPDFRAVVSSTAIVRVRAPHSTSPRLRLSCHLLRHLGRHQRVQQYSKVFSISPECSQK